MSNIVFFSIPAHGHTNPTIEVVRELVKNDNQVWYYSFNEFKEKIESTGAKFISCDEYLPELKEGEEKKIGKDFSALIEMTVNVTIALEEKICSELAEFEPNCIIADSICIWGKLFAQKLNIKYICSTTTFAFNEHTAKMMKQGFGEIINMMLSMGRINKKIEVLRSRGYDIKNLISLISNDNDTPTIVYTSKEFQPLAETFSNKFYFIGPSVAKITVEPIEKKRKQIYISLGTVNNKNNDFYKNCILAFEKSNVDVIISVGKDTLIDELGKIPDNFKIRNSVDQIKVLQQTDVFITHCGMNSVNESLYYSVPMVLFPQHSEQKMVANRVIDLKAGIILKKNKPQYIKEAADIVMQNNIYKENAYEISKSFKIAGGAVYASEVIVKIIEE
ncbi:MAG: macrolide family glycosyltransferase [Peptostreptococcaceae bacterium]